MRHLGSALPVQRNQIRFSLFLGERKGSFCWGILLINEVSAWEIDCSSLLHRSVWKHRSAFIAVIRASWIKASWHKFHLFLLVSILHQRQCFQLNNTQRSTIHTSFSMKLSLGTWFSVTEMSLNIDGKKSFHDCWKLLLHYAFISPHWGGREIKLLISNFINSLIYSESHIKQNFALKYLSIPSLLCARYFS